ncbi:MAG TPA: 5-formyltetrahydrofolate cyclo-ligase [Chitinophagaceae bacterium]|nr:5-formyltetrahydrofolate cyclo-ligase [Chitinophagaceae bacterium]
MLKQEARLLYRRKREELTPKELLKFDDLILIQFQRLSLPLLSHILSFYPMEEKREINTFIITDYLRFVNPGLVVAYPRADFTHNNLQAIACGDDDEFEINRYGIAQPIGKDILSPDCLDLVLVPLLSFDLRGYRVGYGKGFYDRFLHQCRADCVKVGLSYFDAIDAIDDADRFDVPLDFCITPQTAYVF